MKKTLLVIDDDAAVRESLGEVLRLRGFEALTADSAEEALAVLEINRPTVVIVDYHLTGINGAEATRQIRARHPLIAVVGISADPRRRDELLDAGASAFLPKPIDPEILITTASEFGQCRAGEASWSSRSG
jgi:CheY-like chemotaxis protein